MIVSNVSFVSQFSRPRNKAKETETIHLSDSHRPSMVHDTKKFYFSFNSHWVTSLHVVACVQLCSVIRI